MAEKINIQTTTVNGEHDLSSVEATDYVAVGPENGRAILMPAGESLTDERTPVAGAEDGAITRLDGGQVIKLGGEVLVATDVTVEQPPKADS